eukprot:TRINITY_DN19072_c0_g1_i2.p1 TRINITY_DN19072_c0_g1~~TRINITY_DN19072_c0_g1_i2.p1  ORF type:complete len:172 (-),score=85.53 TRINITY_DN19072_c0_g1_i2:67-510(-)
MLRSLVGSEMCIRDRYALAHNAERVVIFDWDVHHGDGTEAILKQLGGPEGILHVSIHRTGVDVLGVDLEGKPRTFYPGSGVDPNNQDSTINIPLKVTSEGQCYGDREYLEMMECVVCLLYTSDAADEEDSVDLGGRRIIKKKKKWKI